MGQPLPDDTTKGADGASFVVDAQAHTIFVSEIELGEIAYVCELPNRPMGERNYPASPMAARPSAIQSILASLRWPQL